MNPKLKIALSIVFVLAVAFFVARAFWPKPSPVHKAPAKAVAKKIAPVKKEALPSPVPGPAEMAIILDDWGQNASLVDDAIAVGRPLTLSVLPNLRHSRDIAERAYANGLGVMLHMPMQPRSNRQPAEPHTILTTTPDGEIARLLDEALASVPHAEGVNNHQGSAATGDERVMRAVLSHLKKKGLFFVDSQVIATSVGRKVASETGIRFAARQVFIDNTATVEAVKQELERAARLARQRGRLIVIGHDKKLTLAAIRESVPQIEKSGVKLVLAKELVQ